MSAVLTPARASRERCLLHVTELLAARYALNQYLLAALVSRMRTRASTGMSGARNVAMTRVQARRMAGVDSRTPTPTRISDEVSVATIPLRIHHPASSDDVALVQTFGALVRGDPQNLLNEFLLPPGETVTCALVPGGAVVITGAPHG